MPAIYSLSLKEMQEEIFFPSFAYLEKLLLLTSYPQGLLLRSKIFKEKKNLKKQGIVVS